MEINYFKNIKILVRGAGDIATGVIWNLAYAGFKVVCTDIEQPTCIRTEVSYSSAIYEKKKELDGISCVYVKNINDIANEWNRNNVVLLIDKDVKVLEKIKFDVVVDAILAKKNLGTNKNMAEAVIGIGPGFTVGIDCDYVIETMRGHNLAKIYEKDSAIENTGVPGLIVSYDKDRVIYSPITGIFHNKHKIGDVVKKNEVISVIEEVIDGKSSGRFVELKASIEGLLRGILRDGFYATSGLKVADIDPRYSEYDNCFTISDKARSIGAAVVTTIMHIYNK